MYQLVAQPVAVDGGVALYRAGVGLCHWGSQMGPDRRTLGQAAPSLAAPTLVYTDGYGAYGSFFSAWQPRPCEKFDGGTATVQGVNNSLRHRCGWLERRSSARARHRCGWLERRLLLTVEAHNRDTDKRLNRRQRRYADSTH